MSYKAAVLYDYPIAYYPLDDLTTVDIEDYTEILSSYDTYQDILDDPSLSMYANIYGDVAYDHSGCENDGIYGGDPETGILPLVSGNSRSTKITNNNSVEYYITKDYTATTTTSQFATEQSSDNDFTIEFWFYPSFTTATYTPIVADTTHNIGLFYEKGNIVFNIETDSISYTLPYTKKAFYIVATYSKDAIALYVDGVLVKNKTLLNFKFDNLFISFKTGPTTSASDYFLINSVAFYRYTLSQQAMLYHMQEAKSLPAINVVSPNEGQVFSIYDNDLSTIHRFVYPTNKTWLEIFRNGVDYVSDNPHLEMTYSELGGSNTVVMDDFISIPSSLTIDSTKIEWVGDNGVSVSISADGNTYTPCVNGQQIPGYTLTNFGSLSGLYIRITMSSTDISKFLPKLYSLSLSFYNNQKIYAENGIASIETLEEISGLSNYDIVFGPEVKEILSRDERNGLRAFENAGFKVSTDEEINTIEFFYTPKSLLESGLISASAVNSEYSWNSLGIISKANISEIYVNGVNKTAETSIGNVFKLGQLHHVIIVLTSAVSGDVLFNYSLNGSTEALYQNIAIYPIQFTNTDAFANYDYYIRRQTLSVTDSSTVQMTEDGPSVYNNDWVVIQTI